MKSAVYFLLFTSLFLLGVAAGIADEPNLPAPKILEPDADGVQRGTITLDSYSYTPSHLIVQAGKSVELTLTRATLITPHNFLLKEPDAGIDIEENVGHSEPTKVRFTPTKPGTFLFYCDRKLPFRPSHREKGMEGRLEVRE